MADDEPEPPTPSPLDRVGRALRSRTGLLTEALVVVAAFWWMLRVRLSAMDRMVRGGQVFFSGTDPYYHLRNLYVTLHHFPATLEFDPWTYFPLGTASGQFGTLFDTILAAALLAGGGGAVPDETTIRTWAAIYPAVLGALTVLPVYATVRLATNRVGAAYATLGISLVSGQFLLRTLAGTFDHHAAEALFSTAAAAGLLGALRVAHVRAPALEDAWSPVPRSLEEAGDRLRAVPSRDALAVLATSAVAGLLLALYLLVWNYGILFVGIFDLFAVLAYVAAVRVGRDTAPLTLALVPLFLAAAVPLALAVDVAAFNLHRHSLLQPALLLLSAAGVLVLEGLRPLVERVRPADAPEGLAYAGAAAVAVLVGAGLAALVLPDLVGTLAGGWSWVAGQGEGSRVKTIAEAQTLGWSGLVDQVSWMAYPAAVAVALAGGRAWEEGDPAASLLLAWGGVILVATINQVRFSYYAGVVVVVLNGYLVGELARMSGLANRVREALPDAPDPGDRLSDRSSTAAQLGSVLLVAVFLLPGLVVATDGPPARAWEVPDRVGPGEAAEWDPGLRWMAGNTTPVPGFDLTEPHDEHPGYEEGAYGVLSWWDYGHWIQTTARRPPVANPFQQGAPFASDYFTSTPDESEALLEDWEGDQRVRYVMIDDAMATGKFGAITVWAERQELNQPASRDVTIRNQTVELPVLRDAYWNTTLARLYFDDADGMAHYRLVHEVREGPGYTFVGHVLQVGRESAQVACFHQTFPSARCPVQPAGDDVQGKIERGEPVPVANRDGAQVGYAWDVRYVSTLKTFERVEGAVLAGDAPAGATVTAEVPLQVHGFRPFTYERTTAVPAGDGNASYALRVSYATTPLEGEAESPVEARAPYTVTVTDPDGAVLEEHPVEVPDAAVLGGETVPVDGSG